MMNKETPVEYLSRWWEIIQIIMHPIIPFGQEIVDKELSKNRIEEYPVILPLFNDPVFDR